MPEEELSEENPIFTEENILDDETCTVDDNLLKFFNINNKINNVKVFLDKKKEYKQNYENDVELNRDLLNTRLGMLNNIKSVNYYNKKLIMTQIAILFGIIIIITSIVVLNNKK
jgi:hypothetical protein